MLRFKTAIATLLLSAAALPAFAQSDTRGSWVDQRQARQSHRIEQGVRSGTLTEREAVRLERGQARVRRLEDRARADGVVTPWEHRRLDRALDVQSRHIYRESHDRQSRHRFDGHREGWRNHRHDPRHGWGGQHFEGRHGWGGQRFESRRDHRFDRG